MIEEIHIELEKLGIPIVGVSTSKDTIINFEDNATDIEKEKAFSVVRRFIPTRVLSETEFLAELLLKLQNLLVINISQNTSIKIDFDITATSKQRQTAQIFVNTFIPKTDAEISAEILANKDALIEQLLKERFYGFALD